MPACPNGSRLKPGELQEFIWYYAENVLPLVTLQRPYLAPFVALQQAVLIPLEDMCATEPEPLPELDWAEILLYAANPVTHLKVGEWLLAFYKQQVWQTYCECTPSTGAGTCPPLATFGNPTTGHNFEGLKFAGSASVPHGWTGCTITRNVTAATNPSAYYVGYRFYDAAHNWLDGGQNSDMSAVTPGVPQNKEIGALYNATIRNAVRTVEIWARPTGTGTQADFVTYTFTPQLSATFTGTCQDVTVTPPPPEPEPEPPPPPFPPPPGPGGTCDLDALCAKLEAAIGVLTNINTVTTAHQLYDAPAGYDLGQLHSGLYGTSTFPISKLIGVAVDITSPLPSRQLEGQPKYLWDVGWMSIGTADGMLEELRVTRDTQVWQPRHMREATSFGWALKPGIVMNVRELRAQQF